MSTIRVAHNVSVQTKVEISRDFDKNLEWQLARALYDQLSAMDENDFIDFLLENMTVLDDGKADLEKRYGAK